MTKSTAMKIKPEIVAIRLENRLAIATKNSTPVVNARPIGISYFPIVMFRGVLYSWSLRWNRRTSTLSALRKKLQTMPNA
jgi:hypothetical protein